MEGTTSGEGRSALSSNPKTLRFQGQPKVQGGPRPAMEDKDVWEVRGTLGAKVEGTPDVDQAVSAVETWQVKAKVVNNPGSMEDKDVWELRGTMERSRSARGYRWTFRGRVGGRRGAETGVWNVSARKTASSRRRGAMPDKDVWEFRARPAGESILGSLTLILKTPLTFDH